MEKFADRHEAGKILAEKLKKYAGNKNVIVLALPRGGVPVGYQIAKTLSVPLDVFIVRKLGVPGHEELAMGAMAMDGTVIFNQEIINSLHINKKMMDEVIQSEQQELQRRQKKYRGNKFQAQLENKIIILVDDGIATGATLKAAIKALRKFKPLQIIVAVPVASEEICVEISGLVDQLICILKPADFYAVGQAYENFSQTTDEEVFALLNGEQSDR